MDVELNCTNTKVLSFKLQDLAFRAFIPSVRDEPEIYRRSEDTDGMSTTNVCLLRSTQTDEPGDPQIRNVWKHRRRRVQTGVVNFVAPERSFATNGEHNSLALFDR